MLNYCIDKSHKNSLQEETKKNNTIAKDGWEISFSCNDEDHSLMQLGEIESTTRRGANIKMEPETRLLKIDESIKAEKSVIPREAKRRGILSKL